MQQVDAQNKKPLRRRIANWLLILLALIVIVRIGDYAWFRTQVPLRFTSANWTGNWKTQQYGLSGKLLVKLPDPMPENQDFDAEVLVYYPIYSVWNTGRFVKMEFVGNFSPETSTSSGVAENEIPGSRGKLMFKATAGNQVVDYVAMMDESGTRIIGSYVSQSPSDIGYFFIQNY
ncbi:MAG: hypothetical protein QM501_11220 [Gimesia sp.]